MILKKYFNIPITSIDVNIKFECTQTFKSNPTKEFINALQKVKGTIKEPNTTDNVSFNTLLYTAVNYFFESIYGDISNDIFKQHRVKDSDYTIRYIKQCFDNCNHTGYVPKERFVNEFVPLHNADWFKECYLVIQTAFFYDSVFGSHQFLDYTEHYATTGNKLPIENYKFDIDVLEKKYNDIDIDKTKHFNSISNYLYLWYYSAIELILNESTIKNNNFRQSERNNEFRIYNALAMCPRTLRYEQAFKLVLCDISSAYPTMIDKHVGSDLGKSIYDNLAKEKNISRIEAKRIFNKALNSEKYRPLNSKQRNDYYNLLLNCGYSDKQVQTIITEITDSKKYKFFDWASEREKFLIDRFKKENGLQNGSRIHDALLFLYDSNFDYSKIKLNFDIFNFSFENLNEPILNNTFFNSNRFIKRKKISFVHKEIGLANSWNETLPKDVKGTFFDSVNVILNKGRYAVKKGKEASLESTHDVSLNITFFNSEYRYLSANFKTETYDSELGLVHLVNNYDSLIDNIYNSLRIIKTINGRSLNKFELQKVLFRYRKLSNLCFDVQTILYDIINLPIESLDDNEFNNCIKTRDYVINSDVKCSNDFIFNIALNKARAKVNDIYYLNLMLTWFKDNPHTFLKCDDIGLNRKNERLKLMLDAFNFLFVCSKHFKSAQKMVHLSSTLVNTKLKYQTFEAKSVRDNRNKERNQKKINKLEQKIKELINEIETLKNNQKTILDYFNSNHIDKSIVLTTINYDSEILKYILDLKQPPAPAPIKEIEVPKVLQFETDISKSVFYNKVPDYTDFINSKSLNGYNLEFYKFHKRNWIEVLEQMKQGCRTIKYYDVNDISNNIFFKEVPNYKNYNKQNLTQYEKEFYKYHSSNWLNVLTQMKAGAKTIKYYDVNKKTLLQKVG